MRWSGPLFLCAALLAVAAARSLEPTVRILGDDARSASLAGSQQGIVRIPLQRVRSTGLTGVVADALIQTDAGGVPLRNADNTQYIGTINVGTPAKEFRVIYDSGSANTWVFSTDCSASSDRAECSAAACSNHRQLDASASTTHASDCGGPCGNTYKIKYGSGDVSGKIISESVDLGGQHATGFKMMGATCVKSHDARVFDSSAFDGVVGLGHKDLGIDGTVPILELLQEQQVISKRQFWFYLTKNAASGSTLGLGELDPALYHADSLKWFDTIQGAKHWAICLTGLKVGDREVDLSACNGCCPAVPDSGTTLMSGPQSMMQGPSGLWNLMGKVDAGCGNVDSMPNIEMKLDHHTYTLTPSEYVFKASAAAQCEDGFYEMDFPAEMGKVWVLGDVFLQSYMSVFDAQNKKVALAKAK